MSELRKRLKATTPKWFVKIRAFAVWLGSAAMGVASVSAMFPEFIPSFFVKVAGYALVAAICMGFTASTAAINPPYPEGEDLEPKP